MTEKTKTEYETVEKEETYVECDMGGCFNTDEQWEMVDFAVNPRYDKSERKEPQVIEVVDDRMEAEEWVIEQKERQRANRNLEQELAIEKHSLKSEGFIPPGVGQGVKGDISTKPAKGYITKSTTSKPECDAELHVCLSCLSQVFGIDIDPDGVCDVDASSGRVRIAEETNAWIDEDIVGELLIITTFAFFGLLAFGVLFL